MISPLAKAIAKSFETEPEAWFHNCYTIRNHRASIEIWTANVPILNFQINNDGARISLIDKFYLWPKYRQLYTKAAIARLALTTENKTP